MRKKFKHMHRYMEYYYVKSGSGNVVVDGKRFKFGKDDIIVIFPYKYHLIEENGSELVSAAVKLSDICEYFDIIISVEPECPVINAGKIDKALYSMISYEEKNRNCADDMDETGSMLLETSLSSARACVIGGALRVMNLKKVNGTYLSNDADTASRIVRYCMENYTEDISLDKISEKLFLNKYYISKVFSNVIGMSLSDFVNDLRVMHVCRMMENSNDKISNIAAKAGFKSQTAFNLAFKKIVGMTPREYRNGGRIILK